MCLLVSEIMHRGAPEVLLYHKSWKATITSLKQVGVTLNPIKEEIFVRQFSFKFYFYFNFILVGGKESGSTGTAVLSLTSYCDG